MAATRGTWRFLIWFGNGRSRNINNNNNNNNNVNSISWQYSNFIRSSQTLPDDDQGRNFPNKVDANMNVLRQRMEHVRIKESSSWNSSRRRQLIGWNYNSTRYDDHRKRWRSLNLILMSSMELASIFASTIAMVFFTASLCIFIVAYIFK
ncbi:uncharacterized protein LOC127263807 isoform X2 [Andrographis paniculata]|uniref:uncharacterized protein LOC127263807 isoform X2 n=1 Tax=Andrographis paniculata TaxID=175694 RepID=UPI0021E865BD|nr:uncharacterized protein LOC127263807 isoform X2 [Andrographis paniculata]